MIGIDNQEIIMSKIIYKGGSEEKTNNESAGIVKTYRTASDELAKL